MKPPRFAYARAESVEYALSRLSDRDGARLLSGGRSLVPLLKLRMAEAAAILLLALLLLAVDPAIAQPPCGNRGTEPVFARIETAGNMRCAGTSVEGRREEWYCPKLETEVPGYGKCGPENSAPGFECVFKEALEVKEYTMTCGTPASKCIRGQYRAITTVPNFEAKKCTR